MRYIVENVVVLLLVNDFASLQKCFALLGLGRRLLQPVLVTWIFNEHLLCTSEICARVRLILRVCGAQQGMQVGP